MLWVGTSNKQSWRDEGPQPQCTATANSCSVQRLCDSALKHHAKVLARMATRKIPKGEVVRASTCAARRPAARPIEESLKPLPHAEGLGLHAPL
jgi:hypothetical protein